MESVCSQMKNFVCIGAPFIFTYYKYSSEWLDWLKELWKWHISLNYSQINLEFNFAFISVNIWTKNVIPGVKLIWSENMMLSHHVACFYSNLANKFQVLNTEWLQHNSFTQSTDCFLAVSKCSCMFASSAWYVGRVDDGGNTFCKNRKMWR